MRNKLVIGNIPGHKDCSGVLFDFIAKWNQTIKPLHLAAFLQGKNAWNGSFRDKSPKKTEGLLDDLRDQLLSGAKSVFQFKLFVKKMNYLDPRLCQLQAINDFYEEVFKQEYEKIFQSKLSLSSFMEGLPATDKFMVFPKKFNFSSSKWVDLWNEYRMSDADSGLHRCESLNFDYGTRPESFLCHNIRNEKQNYLLTYEERYSEKRSGENNLDDYIRFLYNYKDYESEIEMKNGITLREAFILSLFEYWKNGKYFAPRDKTGNYLAVPCFGSVCQDGDYDERYRPIPIIIFSEHALESTWASTKRGLPDLRLVKVYTAKETFNL
jgi:hypothetical protein